MTTVRVLVVDDEPSAREAIRELLRAEGEVTVVGECRNGMEALASLRGGNIDLVFLDVVMPEIDGLAVIEQLGADRPAIVFVTAHDHYTLRAFDIHAVYYLVKPFSDERFFAALAHAKTLIAQGRTQVTANVAARPGPHQWRHAEGALDVLPPVGSREVGLGPGRAHAPQHRTNGRPQRHSQSRGLIETPAHPAPWMQWYRHNAVGSVEDPLT